MLSGVHTFTYYVNVLFYKNSFLHANFTICKIYSVNYISLIYRTVISLVINGDCLYKERHQKLAVDQR